MRTCKMCGQTKSLDQFANAGIIKGVEYKRHLCIPCYSISKKPRKNKVKKEYIDWKKTLQCNRCGINDHRVLQFHHHRDKESEISTMLSRGFSLDNIKIEAEKCEVLCANCHQIEHYNGA
jgi:Fe2+ or Zn2+ uptake regulation protein